MDFLWKIYEKNRPIFKDKTKEIYRTKNKSKTEVLIIKLDKSSKEVDKFRKEKKFQIIEIINKNNSIFIILEYFNHILSHPLIGPIYLKLTNEENNAITSKLKAIVLLDIKNKFNVKQNGYFIKAIFKNIGYMKVLMFEYIRLLKIGEKVCFMYSKEKERYSIKITEKRRVFYDDRYNYTMIEIFDNEKIDNIMVFNDKFNFMNTLHNEVICLYIKTGKINQNTIIGYNNNDNTDDNKRVYNQRIILKSRETNKEIIFLNDKNNNYPLIDSSFMDFHLILMDLRKYLTFDKNILPKMKKIKHFKYKAIQAGIMKSFGILKDGRLTLKSSQTFQIFDQNLEKNEYLHFDFTFSSHYMVKNGDILTLPCSKIIRFDNKNKYSIIQELPNPSINDRRIVCEYNDLLLLIGDEPFIEIFKYDKIKVEYVFEKNYPIGEKINDASKIKTDQIVIIHGFNIDFFNVYDNKISVIAKCKLKKPKEDYSTMTYFTFYHFLYKNRYLLCDNTYGFILLFDIRLKKFVCKLSSCISSLYNLFLLSNGNLFNSHLDEICIFDKKVHLIQHFNTKINKGIESIICQMNNGTIILNERF